MAREYKDSGIEWIGRIPKDWKVCKLNYIYKFQIGATPPTNVESYFNGDIKWANISDLGARTVFDTNKKLSNSGVDKCCMSISPKGSLMYSFKLSVGLVSFCGDDMYTNEAIATFLEGYGYLPYLYYMAPIAIIHNANFNIYGAPILNQELIKGAKIIVPPLAEQRAIASYLDCKCAEIDSLVELQEQMIAQLTDYKQSVITEAVTKGLNSEAELVPSGIDWIGDVPKGWKIVKLSLLTTKIGSGSTPTGGASIYVNEGVKFLRSQNVFFEGLDLSEVAYITDEIDEEMKGTRVMPGDVLINITGGSIGRCYYVDNSLGRANVNQHVSIIRPSKVDTHFLKYYLQSFVGQFQVSLLQNGGNREGLSAAALSNFKILLPTKEEQQSIASYLNTKCAEIDSLIDLKRQKIEALKDYKKSVIFEAVTGKTNID